MGWRDAPLVEAEPAWRRAPLADETEEPISSDRTVLDDAKYVAGRTVRMAAEGIAALPLVAMDAGVGVRNSITGENYDLPSKMFRENLDSLGLPRPQTRTEKVTDFVGQALVSSMVPAPSIGAPAPPGFRPNISTTADDVIAQGEKHSVPVFFDDVTQSAMAKKASVAAENLGPLGTASGRAAQAKAAQSAAERLAGRLAVEGDDVPQIVQKGMRTRLDQFREAADRLYTRAAKELDQFGDVKTKSFDDAIAQEIAKQERLGTAANHDVIRSLQAFKDAPRGNFSLTRELRSQLSSKISEYYGGNAAIGEKGVTSLQVAKEALESDLAKFAQSSGGRGYNFWKTADGFYRANLVPFKEAGLKTLVKSPEPEKAWRFLVSQSDVKSRATRMYRALDEEGRSAVRYGLVKDAMEKATNANGSFSPARFAKYLEDHQNAVTTFFKGRDLAEIDGFSKLMRHVERAGQFAENPPTGNRVILPALLVGGAFNPKAAAVAAGGGVALKTLFQTKQGRDLLLSASRASPEQMAKVSDRIARYLSAATVVSATQGPSSREE